MAGNRWTRREFVRRQVMGSAACLAVGASHLACSRRGGRDTGTRVVVLGLDGMDPSLVAGRTSAGAA